MYLELQEIQTDQELPDHLVHQLHQDRLVILDLQKVPLLLHNATMTI
jgi:hypothetical protein